MSIVLEILSFAQDLAVDRVSARFRIKYKQKTGREAFVA